MLENEHSALATEWSYLEDELRSSAQVWDDATHGVFETQFWDAIAQAIPSYLSALRDLSDAVASADSFLRDNPL